MPDGELKIIKLFYGRVVMIKTFLRCLFILIKFITFWLLLIQSFPTY